MICSNCGNTIKDESKFCQYCGTAVSAAAQTADTQQPAAEAAAVYTPPAVEGQPADAENAAAAAYTVVEESQPQTSAYQPPVPPYYTGKPQASTPVPPYSTGRAAEPAARTPLCRVTRAGHQQKRIRYRVSDPLACRRAVRLLLLPGLCRHALLHSRRDLRCGRDEEPCQ